MCDFEKEEEEKLSEEQVHPMRPFPSVYLEVGKEGDSFGIIELELFADTPKTSENFLQLCTGAHFGESGE